MATIEVENPSIPYTGPDTTIAFAPIPWTSSDAKFTTQNSDGTWTDYMINGRYERDNCTYMLGITSPVGFQGKSVAFCQLASPTLLWIVDFTACKFATDPEIPDPVPSDNRWVILDAFFEPAMITVSADGVTPLKRITGTYIYGHQQPAANMLQNISYSRPPWLEDTFSRTIPASSLMKRLSDAPTQAGNNGPTGFISR